MKNPKFTESYLSFRIGRDVWVRMVFVGDARQEHFDKLDEILKLTRDTFPTSPLPGAASGEIAAGGTDGQS